MITEVFKTTPKDKKLRDFFKKEEEIQTIKFNVLDPEMKDFDFPRYEDTIIDTNYIEENKVFLNKTFFIDFDMKKLLPEQKEIVEKYLELKEMLEYSANEISKYGSELKKLKEIEENRTPEIEQKLEKLKKEYQLKKRKLELLIEKNGNIVVEKVKVEEKRDYAKEDRLFIEFYSKAVKEAFGSVYDFEIMKELENSVYSLESKRSLRELASPSTTREVKDIIIRSQTDKLEKYTEMLEVSFENMINKMPYDTNRDELYYQNVTKPLNKFKNELKDDLREKYKIISNKLDRIVYDYENFLKSKNKSVEKEEEYKEIEKKLDFNEEIEKIKNEMYNIKREHDKIIGKNLLSSRRNLKMNIDNYREYLKEFKDIDISEIPFIINKDKLALFLLNISRLNLFENTSFGYGYNDLSKTDGLPFGDLQKFDNEAEIESMRKSLRNIIESLPEAVTETDKINKAMIEELIINNYQDDLDDKSHIDLFIDPEYLFKVSFEWKKRDPELVFKKADKFFAIPNIIGTFDNFKNLYENNIDKLNTKLFPMNKMQIKSNLSDEELKNVFFEYNYFVTENYDKIVEAKFSSILKTMTILNHAFLQNPINNSLFIAPLARNKVEYLYEHIPVGKVESSDLMNDLISDEYYNMLLSYNVGNEIHWEIDETQSIQNLMNIKSIAYRDNNMFLKEMKDNIDIFTKKPSSLLPFLDASNISLKSILLKNIKKQGLEWTKIKELKGN